MTRNHPKPPYNIIHAAPAGCERNYIAHRYPEKILQRLQMGLIIINFWTITV